MGDGTKKPGYYAIIPADVRYDETLRPSAKLLYGELNALAGADGYCWASNKYFAELFGLSVNTISEIVGELEKRGYIKTELIRAEKGNITERRIYAGVYIVDRGIPKNLDTPIPVNLDTPIPKKRGRGIPKNREENNTSNYQYTPLPPEIHKRLSEYSAGNEDLLAALTAFAEVRKKKKNPLLTDRQASLLLNKIDLLSAGDDGHKIALLNNAVLRGWESVYPLKPDEAPRATGRASEREVVKEWT